MKKIVLFVEGEGEADAAPLLVKQILAGDPTVWQSVILDPIRSGLEKSTNFMRRICGKRNYKRL